MDSAYVSQELRARLHQLGFIDIIIAGKGNYVFTIDLDCCVLPLLASI
jgi:hypothetical protein